MNTVVSRETLIRRLKSDRFADLEPGESLTAALTTHSRDVWTHLAASGTVDGLDWAWGQGATFTPTDGQTYLTLALLQRQDENLFAVASWLCEHGAVLPAAAPPAPEPMSERLFTQDSLWRQVVDKNPPAATWLAAQGVPVCFERPEAGLLLGHVLRTHRHKALPVVELLLEAGVDVLAQDEEGETVLHTLARINVPDDNLKDPFKQLWTTLVNAGAQGRCPNDAGETALDLLDPENRAFAVAASRAQSADTSAEGLARRARKNRA